MFNNYLVRKQVVLDYKILILNSGQIGFSQRGQPMILVKKMEILPYPSLDEIKSWSDSPDTLLPFWNIWATEKAWAQITAEFQMFDYIEVQSKVVFELPSNQCCCQWCFWILLFKKIVLILGSIFLRPIWCDNIYFMQQFFSKLQKSFKAVL